MALRRNLLVAVASTAVVAALMTAYLLSHRVKPGPPAGLVYTSSGYGGYVPRQQASTPSAAAGGQKPSQAAESVDASTMWNAFNADRYTDAEHAADQVIASTATPPTDLVAARSVLGYAAARRHDMALARVRFASAARAAQGLPAGTRPAGPDGLPAATMGEDALYQHAVCTQALGDRVGAETEYLDFIRSHTDSPLVQACLSRIATLHGGDVPKADMAVYNEATTAEKKADNAKARAQSICGPECIAELLSRRRPTPPRSSAPLPKREGEENTDGALVEKLASEMNTGPDGTTLDSLASVAARHGLPCEGVSLTMNGLKSQSLPLIALLREADQPGQAPGSGHYVIVERVDQSGVAIWDPDAHGVGRPDRYTVPIAEWNRSWHGIALRFTDGNA